MKHTKTRIIKAGKEIIRAQYGISVTDHSYFSVTGEMGEKRRGPYRDYDMIHTEKNGAFYLYAGGCIHEEILKYFPKLSDIVKLHLSDINGIPMHCIENGWYYKMQGDFEVLQNELRLSDTELTEVLKIKDKQTFSNYLHEFLFPRYKKEADAVIEKYNLSVPVSN